MIELLKKQWTYILYDDSGKLLFSVVCGSVGLFDRNIYLNANEIKAYDMNGEIYLDTLAEQIRKNPDKFESRHVKI